MVLLSMVNFTIFSLAPVSSSSIVSYPTFLLIAVEGTEGRMRYFARESVALCCEFDYISWKCWF